MIGQIVSISFLNHSLHRLRTLSYNLCLNPEGRTIKRTARASRSVTDNYTSNYYTKTYIYYFLTIDIIQG